MTNVDLERVSQVVQEFKENCDPQFLEIANVRWDRGEDDGEIVYEIHVEVEDVADIPNTTSTYCYPVADFGRERGLYLWDTVTDWKSKTLRLRFRFDE